MKIQVTDRTVDLTVGYARLSTREQELGTNAKERDIERLTAAGCDVILYETGSRSDNGRSELLSLLEMIRRAEIAGCVFTRLDRITDSSVLLEQVITASLDSPSVRVRSLDDAIDFTTVGGRLQARLLVNFARAEVERLSERVKNGWAHLRTTGKAVHAPFGYQIVEDRYELNHTPFICELSPRNEFTVAQVAAIAVQAFLDAQSLRGGIRIINERFGLHRFAHNNKPGPRKGGIVAPGRFGWSPGGFSTWITNPVLSGHTAYLRRTDRSVTIPNTHPEHVLVDEQTRAAIAKTLKTNRRIRGFGKTRSKYPLSGLVFCGECRAVCYSVSGSRGKNLEGYNYYYQCSNWRSRACSQRKMIRMEVLEQDCDRALAAKASELASFTDATTAVEPQAEPPELLRLRDELAYYQNAPSDRAAAVVDQLEREIYELGQKMQSRDRERGHNYELLRFVFKDQGYWKSLETSERREIYQALVSRIVMKDGEVLEIDLNL